MITAQEANKVAKENPYAERDRMLEQLAEVIKEYANNGRFELQYPWGEVAKKEKISQQIFKELEKSGYKLDLETKESIMISWQDVS